MLNIKAPKNLALGQAGVYRVISELLLRGISAAVPIVDVGIDLILDNDIKVQVKSANQRTQEYKNKGKEYILGPAYFWSLNSSQKGSKHKYIKRPVLYSDQVNYFVLWGIDENRFWIPPASLLDAAGTLILYPKGTSSKPCGSGAAVLKYENRWDLLTV